MKKAIVLAAREKLGIHICKQLLKHDYEIYALDEERFQTERHEQRWMWIGRNANIQLYDMSDNNINIDHEKTTIVFLPLYLYEQKQDEGAIEHFQLFVNTYLKPLKNIKIVALYTPYSLLELRSLYEDLASILSDRTYMIVVTNKK